MRHATLFCAKLARVGVCVLLAAGVSLVWLSVSSGPGLAQSSERQFELDSVRKMMEDLKRKADAARLKAAPRDSAPVRSEPESTPAAPRASVETVQPAIDPVSPPRIHSEKAAQREREAEDVLETIRRAREAREAWNDDPNPVFDTLPPSPPAKRARDSVLAQQRSAEAPFTPVGEPDVILFPDPERVKPTLGGSGARQALGGPVPKLSDLRGQHGGKIKARHVTVLLVMDVGKRGIRRWSKTADPMLCVHEFCFLSRGPTKSAVRHARRVAFGPAVALGQRALACRSSPACVFRNVDLGAAEARLQPIDLRFLRHDRRHAELVRADPTCEVVAGSLSCARPISGDTWRAWIVPERVAEMAGAKALQRALAAGLPRARARQVQR